MPRPKLPPPTRPSSRHRPPSCITTMTATSTSERLETQRSRHFFGVTQKHDGSPHCYLVIGSTGRDYPPPPTTRRLLLGSQKSQKSAGRKPLIVSAGSTKLLTACLEDCIQCTLLTIGKGRVGLGGRTHSVRPRVSIPNGFWLEHFVIRKTGKIYQTYIECEYMSVYQYKARVNLVFVGRRGQLV